MKKLCITEFKHGNIFPLSSRYSSFFFSDYFQNSFLDSVLLQPQLLSPSYDHRITESQNIKGLKGLLGII